MAQTAHIELSDNTAQAGPALDADSCYQALLARDTRFDGAFFVAVRTTGIYCRPICRVKPALRRNCDFYASAVAAESHGFRPCLRCRPELAPGYSEMEAHQRLAALALDRIESGVLAGESIEDIADELGVSTRHLRRTIKRELGVTPVELAQTYRLHLARRLMSNANLKLTDIAFASGFTSLRRFNALFKQRYALTPREFKRKRGQKTNTDRIHFDLTYRPPYDWDSLLAFFQSRAIPGIEAIRQNAYHRTVGLRDCKGTITVTHEPHQNCLRVYIDQTLLPVLTLIINRLQRQFDLRCDPDAIQIQLGTLAEPRPGLRLPGAFDGFEVATRAILGQLISVKAANTLAARFTAASGTPIDTGQSDLHLLTPDAQTVARLKADAIHAVGIPLKKAESILALAKAVRDNRIELTPTLNITQQMQTLTDLPGIGSWTAEYIAMRVLAWPDAFPHTDLGIRKALNTKSNARILRMAEAWRPWRSYAAMHLWNSLEPSA
ncbi:MAG: DNA-3-methyladenine glycosylase 2 [Leptospiraceae bacterium]|nr:DNA-3-methyladenine glycosylase 2 [Leptospiraceae bacterium]